MWVSPESAH